MVTYFDATAGGAVGAAAIEMVMLSETCFARN